MKSTKFIFQLIFTLVSILQMGCAGCSRGPVGSVDAPRTSVNNPPVIVSLSPLTALVQIGTELVLSSTAIDPNGDRISYLWTSDNGSFLGDINHSNIVSWIAPETVGNYEIILTVTDEKGAIATKIVRVEAVLDVVNNHPPVVQFFNIIDSEGGECNTTTNDNVTCTGSPNDGSLRVLENTYITIDVVAEDPEDDPLSYAWFQSAGTLEGNTQDTLVRWVAPSLTSNGQNLNAELTVEVTDQLGQSSAMTAIGTIYVESTNATNDDDGDGFPDIADNCPNSSNPDQLDSDGDGIGNECDNCNLFNPNQADIDGDGLGSECDDDENCPIAEREVYYRDADNDGYPSETGALTLCGPSGDYLFTSPPSFDCDDSNMFVKPGGTEICGDTLDNNCDGATDAEDTTCGGPGPPPGDDEGDPEIDEDGDRVDDSSDNCVGVYNPDQEDLNGDGEGDHCDDTDGDGTLDIDDACPNTNLPMPNQFNIASHTIGLIATPIIGTDEVSFSWDPINIDTNDSPQTVDYQIICSEDMYRLFSSSEQSETNITFSPFTPGRWHTCHILTNVCGQRLSSESITITPPELDDFSNVYPTFGCIDSSYDNNNSTYDLYIQTSDLEDVSLTYDDFDFIKGNINYTFTRSSTVIEGSFTVNLKTAGIASRTLTNDVELYCLSSTQSITYCSIRFNNHAYLSSDIEITGNVIYSINGEIGTTIETTNTWQIGPNTNNINICPDYYNQFDYE